VISLQSVCVSLHMNLSVSQCRNEGQVHRVLPTSNSIHAPSSCHFSAYEQVVYFHDMYADRGVKGRSNQQEQDRCCSLLVLSPSYRDRRVDSAVTILERSHDAIKQLHTLVYALSCYVLSHILFTTKPSLAFHLLLSH
jgi:hypothetical protein